MAHRSDIERLQSAWRALAGVARAEGWRTIPINLEGPCRLLAGRHFPGNEEAVLIGFPSVRVPSDSQLPQGRGFRVARVPGATLGGACEWVSLSRQPSGSSDLFAMMAGDVMGLLEDFPASSQERLFGLFLSRIKAWQDFMEQDRQGVLGPEAETGLYGELVVLRDMIGMGIPAACAVEAWQGPLNGLHDFSVGSGAIEIKTTVSVNSFPARIGSLEQLDPSLKQPLFLAGVRLTISGAGRALPEIVGMLRDCLTGDSPTLSLFESRLLHAGYLDVLADHYTRRFETVGMIVFEVTGAFPGLTRGKVDTAIRQARYELDLDALHVPVVTLGQACAHLGGSHWSC
jgi:hypothetical protein